VEAIEEGDKVKGEIVRILYKDQIRYFKSENAWPFKDNEKESSQHLPESDSGEDDENEADLFQNPNRPALESESETSSDESEEIQNGGLHEDK